MRNHLQCSGFPHIAGADWPIVYPRVSGRVAGHPAVGAKRLPKRARVKARARVALRVGPRVTAGVKARAMLGWQGNPPKQRIVKSVSRTNPTRASRHPASKPPLPALTYHEAIFVLTVGRGFGDS